MNEGLKLDTRDPRGSDRPKRADRIDRIDEIDWPESSEYRQKSQNKPTYQFHVGFESLGFIKFLAVRDKQFFM